MRRLALLSLCAGLFTLAQAGYAPETLTGTVMMVNPHLNLLVIKGQGNVPYDMTVTPGTRIRSGDRTLSLPELNSDMNRPVSVTFVPTNSGDMARIIQIKG